MGSRGGAQEHFQNASFCNKKLNAFFAKAIYLFRFKAQRVRIPKVSFLSELISEFFLQSYVD